MKINQIVEKINKRNTGKTFDIYENKSGNIKIRIDYNNLNAYVPELIKTQMSVYYYKIVKSDDVKKMMKFMKN